MTKRMLSSVALCLTLAAAAGGPAAPPPAGRAPAAGGRGGGGGPPPTTPGGRTTNTRATKPGNSTRTSKRPSRSTSRTWSF